MKLLFFSLNYAPEQVGIGPYSTGLAEALAARGHEVRVVAGQPYYPDWRLLPQGQRGWSRRMERGVEVARCPHYIPRWPSAAKRIAHHTSFALAALSPMLSRRGFKPDIVFAVAPSLLALPDALAAARFSGARLWIHVQDFEVAAAQATGLLRPGGLPARAAGKLERALLRRADMVSSISPQMCARLDRIGIAPERVYELRNWSNHADAFALPPQGDYRAEWGLGRKKVMLYSGNIANKQGLELLVEASRLLAGREDIAFVICGNGPNRAELERLGSGVANLAFHDLQPAERMGELLSLAHAHILPQIAGAADLVLPSKLANMLASGRPVIATAAEGTGLADEVLGCGLVVSPGDAGALARAVVELADNPAQADALGEEAMRRAWERWSGERIVAGAERAMLRIASAGKT